MNGAYAHARKFVRLHFVILGALFAAGAALILFYDKPVLRAPAEAPRALPQGRQVYSVMSGGSGPKITQIVINPFDPKIGERQTMEMTVLYKEPLARAAVVMKSDGGEAAYVFSQAGGGESGEERLYRASWETRDTHERVYAAVVTTEAGGTSSSVELTLR